MFKIDHIFIWSSSQGAEIETFKDSGFTSIISGKHDGQGTSGNYIFFLNFYIEILHISNIQQAEDQFIKFSNNYKKRKNWRESGSSPFGLGLKMNPYRKFNLPFEFAEYKADWFKGDGILLPFSNIDCKKPLLFVVPPSMEFPTYNSVKEMNDDDKPDDFKQNHIHPNGIEKLSSFRLTKTSKTDDSGIDSILKSNGIQIQTGDMHLLELEFDKNRKKKIINMDPLPIIIKY